MARTQKRDQPKLYVIRKFVMAHSVVDASRKDKTTPVHEVFIDDKWQERNLAAAIGFTAEQQEA